MRVRASGGRADCCFLPCGSPQQAAAGYSNPRSRMFLGWLKGAGGRPAGIHVSEIESVELRPENVAFGSQSGVSFVLFFARAGMLHNPGQGELAVFGSLREA